ncbi:MAG: hypothetical protein IJY01_00580 [Clostridia bacterium]|nr:hypothetical protein [Clostridia bacterium]
MSKKDKGFFLFFDWIDRLKDLPSDEAIKIIYALCEYNRNGTDPTEKFTGALKIVVSLMFDQIKRAEKVSEARAEAGQKGGFATANSSKFKQNEDLPQQNVATNTNTNTNTNTHSYECLPRARAPAREDTPAPSMEEVINYCKSKGYSFGVRFYTHYQSKGWQGVTDWRARADFWAEEDKKRTADGKPKIKYGDIDPEEALQNAIRNSGFYDDDDDTGGDEGCL